MKNILLSMALLLLAGIISSCSGQKTLGKNTKKQTVKSQSVSTKTQKTVVASTPQKEQTKPKIENEDKANQAYKTNVIAVYYHDKFNGRKTASGAIFDNSKQTAAHRTLPFGTKLKVINRANGKWIYVTVNDRGPFNKGREIDLTKRAFMDITDNKNKGELLVDIEIVK